MDLFYQAYSAEKQATPPIIIIPGLFGSTANWRGFAKELAQHYYVVVIDQRNHGESPHANSHTYADMVSDLFGFINKQGFEKVVLCGHSMGGKVAMAFSLLYPDRVDRLAVLDIAPVNYTHSHAPYLKALIDVDLTVLGSRSDAEKSLQLTIPETPIRLFLMQSLVGRPGEYRWRLNLPVLLNDMPDITAFPERDLGSLSSDVSAVFIVGEDSSYVLDEYHGKIKSYFSEVNFKVIKGAGHWLHAEKPKQVLSVLNDFLKNDK